MISYIGANKHHRQRKFARRSTKRSVVQSTCKMSRGWMMRRELRSEVLVGRVALATMDRSFEGTRTDHDFKILVKLYVKRRKNGRFHTASPTPKKAQVGNQTMIPPYDSVSAIGSSAWLVFGWLAKARRSKTSHGDGGSVIAKAAKGGKSFSNS